MEHSFDLRGPGTAMAIAAGLAAYGAGVGELRNELLILLIFALAPILIEALHLAAPIVDRQLNGD